MLGGEEMSDQSKSVLDEEVNQNYYEAAKEIAELLTFLPEEARESVVDGFVQGILKA